MPIYPSKKVNRAWKTTKNIWKFLITLVNLVVFNYLIIYADKFQLAVQTSPVKASFTNVMPTASADINAQSIIFDNNDLGGNLTYIVRSGDSIESIAADLNTTVDNIKKVNNLKSNDLRAGQKLTISQLPGIIVTMQEDIALGDFISAYDLNEVDIKTLNNIADSRKIIHKGWELFIPISEKDAQDKGLIDKPEPIVAQQKPDVPTTKPTTKPTASTSTTTNAPVTAATVAPSPKKVVATVSQIVASEGTSTISYKKGTILATWYQKTTTEDGFAAWYCTAYAAQRRPDIFKSGTTFRGNAKEWTANAKRAGYTITKTPSKGAIVVYQPGQGGASSYGHVAIVENVDEEKGLMTISDMNGPAGRGVVTTRIVPYGEWESYIP